MTSPSPCPSSAPPCAPTLSCPSAASLRPASTSPSQAPQRLRRPDTSRIRAAVRNDTIPLVVLEAGLILAWSSGFIGMRYVVDHAPMALALFWRCTLLAVLMLPWAAKTLRHACPRTLLIQCGIGLLAVAGYLAGVGRGIELGVPAGLAALIADLLPIGTALLGVLLLGQRPARQVWIGLAIGLCGVMLATHDALALGHAPLYSYALPLLGMISLAVASLWIKRAGPGVEFGLMPTLWIQSAVCVPVFAAWTLTTHGSLAPVASAGFGASVLVTALLSSLGGYGLYWLCLKRSSPTRVASVLYLSPGVTLLAGALLFGEPLSWLMVAGMGVSVLGVTMVARARG